MNRFTFLKQYATRVVSRLMMALGGNTQIKLLFSMRQLCTVTMSACLILVSPAGMASQGSGDLATTPFLGTGPAPNIVFLMDRSGSMNLCENVNAYPGPSTCSVSETRVKSLKSVMCGVDNCASLTSDSLLSTLTGVRIGMYQFHGSSVNRLNNINDIATNRQSLRASLQAFSPGGSTPLAAGLATVGEYYRNYNDSVSCRKNNVIVLSDGEPTSDNGYWNGINLNQWANPDAFAKVAEKMYDSSTYKNALTHVIGFGPAVDDLQLFKNAVEYQDYKARYVTATDQTALKRAFDALINTAKSIDGSSAAVTHNESTLSDNSAVFITSFESTFWSGNIKARPLYAPGHQKEGRVNNSCSIGTKHCWDRPSFPNHGARKIFTYDDAAKKGVKFKQNKIDDLTVQKEDLEKAITGNVTLTDIVNYIRGSTSKEGYGTNSLRKRQENNGATNLLGDIVNSSPVYVKGAGGAPDAIYVGSNNGMLHAFNAQTGAELFAYIPKAVFSKEDGEGLHNLVSQDFIHRYYVDLTPAVATVGNRVILIGGYRGGAKGVFALDVTNPKSFSASNVLWEYTNDDLGYVYGTPEIITIGGAKHALVSNGYDSTNNVTKLFAFNLDANSTVAVPTPAIVPSSNNMTDAASANNGLSAITAVNNNGSVVAYGGDLNGNVWRIDQAGNASKLFTALQQGAVQPITAPPMIAKHPTQTDDTLMVLVGTGALLAEPDGENTQLQSFYALWDWNGSGEIQSSELERIALIERPSAVVVSNSSISETIRTAECTNGEAKKCVEWFDGTSGDKGWYVNLTETKERVLSPAALLNGYLFLSTVMPGVGSTVCSAGGSGWVLGFRLDGSIYTQAVFDSSQDHKVDKSNSNDKYNHMAQEYVAVGKKNEDGMPTAPKIIKFGSSDSGGGNGGGNGGGGSDGRIPDENDETPYDTKDSSRGDEGMLDSSDSQDDELNEDRIDTSGGTLKRVNWRQLK